MTDQAKLPLRHVTSYTGDDEIERCLDCDGFLAKPGAKCKRCANRVKKAKTDAKEEVRANGVAEKKAEKEKAAAAQVQNWRRNTMKRYIAGLLATKSGSVDRARYFEQNPISRIFK